MFDILDVVEMFDIFDDFEEIFDIFDDFEEIFDIFDFEEMLIILCKYLRIDLYNNKKSEG